MATIDEINAQIREATDTLLAGLAEKRASIQRQNDKLDACIALLPLPNPAMQGFKVQTELYTGDDA